MSNPTNKNLGDEEGLPQGKEKTPDRRTNATDLKGLSEREIREEGLNSGWGMRRKRVCVGVVGGNPTKAPRPLNYLCKKRQGQWRVRKRPAIWRFQLPRRRTTSLGKLMGQARNARRFGVYV